MENPEGEIRRIVVERMHRCDVCHRTFEPSDIEVISRKPDLWMMMVQCADCHAKSFVAAVIDGDQTQPGSGALRRIGAGELQPLVQSMADRSGAENPVTVDDVLEMHAFLEHFNGDFKSLLGTG